MTPKIRFRPSASSASRPASKSPLRTASRKKMSSWQSIVTACHPGRPAGPIRDPLRHTRTSACGEKCVPALALLGRNDTGSASNPHVGAADLVARAKLLCAAARLQPADFEQVGAVGDFEHLAHVLLND